MISPKIPYVFTVIDHPDHGRMVPVDDVIGYLTAAAAAVRQAPAEIWDPPARLVEQARTHPEIAVPLITRGVQLNALEKVAAEFALLVGGDPASEHEPSGKGA